MFVLSLSKDTAVSSSSLKDPHPIFCSTCCGRNCFPDLPYVVCTLWNEEQLRRFKKVRSLASKRKVKSATENRSCSFADARSGVRSTFSGRNSLALQCL